MTCWSSCKTLLDPVPLILMAGFGYDPGIRSSRPVRPVCNPGLLFKPFRLDQLLDTVEKMVKSANTVPQP